MSYTITLESDRLKTGPITDKYIHTQQRFRVTENTFLSLKRLLEEIAEDGES